MVWLQEAYEIVRRANRYMIQIWVATCLAQAHFVTQEEAKAHRHANEAVEVAEKFGFDGFRVAALRARGLVQSEGFKPTSSGLDDLRSALALASRLKLRAEVAHCHAALGFARVDDPAHHLDMAGNIYKSLGMSRWFEHLLDVSMSSELAWP